MVHASQNCFEFINVDKRLVQWYIFRIYDYILRDFQFRSVFYILLERKGFIKFRIFHVWGIIFLFWYLFCKIVEEN